MSSFCHCTYRWPLVLFLFVLPKLKQFNSETDLTISVCTLKLTARADGGYVSKSFTLAWRDMDPSKPMVTKSGKIPYKEASSLACYLRAVPMF
jgi:hypothetical protein